ncbi:MAG: helix-turn-helix domain-containing protein [Candidatus Thioglobus sp.]
MTEELLNTEQASKVLGMKSKSLANSRYTGTGVQIPFIKLGNLVRYKLSDLQNYIEGNTFNHTGEVKGGK